MKSAKVSIEFRNRLSEKLMDLGNFSIAGLVFGQFVSNKEFSAVILVVGVFFAIMCYIGSYILSL